MAAKRIEQEKVQSNPSLARELSFLAVQAGLTDMVGTLGWTLAFPKSEDEVKTALASQARLEEELDRQEVLLLEHQEALLRYGKAEADQETMPQPQS